MLDLLSRGDLLQKDMYCKVVSSSFLFCFMIFSVSISISPFVFWRLFLRGGVLSLFSFV
ncbi:hypothetical protein YC2023_060025 [Brassica napus]|uniref:Uncharacterized protein n=1 Tax=Brassica oleracea TaxID=3712 RepID=A0A3P6F3F8_BRAOL|nr:unnamed protein product [Brassica oleracea]